MTILCALSLLASSAIEEPNGPKVTVWVNDERVLVAAVDQRSDQSRLYLRFSEPSIVLVTSVRWDEITKGMYNEQTYGPHEFKTVVLGLKSTGSLRDREAPKPQRRAGHAEDRKLSRDIRRSGKTGQVHTLMIDAELANWDSDVEMDGYHLYVFPLTRQQVPTPVDGSLHIEVMGEKAVRAGRGDGFFELIRTSERVRKRHFPTSGAATYRIPFRTIHPEFDLNAHTHGLIHARLDVPGQGSFEASITRRVRDFDPVRDRLQLRQDRRFFASEKTRGERPYESSVAR